MNSHGGLRIVVSLFLVAILLPTLLPMPGASAAELPISVFVDGVKLAFTTPPVVVNGRTLVPLRAIFEALGADVDWNAAQRMAFAQKDDTEVSLYLDSLYPSVNHEVQPIEVPAVIVNDRTLAPLRFVGEAFGGTVTWDAATRTVNIYTSDARYAELPKTALDFSLSSADLALFEEDAPSRSTMRPGVTLNLRVRVRKDNPQAQGGGKVRVSLGNTPIDTLPFHMEKTQDVITFFKDYQIPLDADLGANPTLTAEVFGDRLVNDANAANNTASIPVTLAPIERPTNPTRSDSQVVSIKATSDFGTGVAKSGSYLNIIATLTGTSTRTIVGFTVNGALVEEKGAVKSAGAATTQVSHNYYVPWTNNGLLRIGVRLDSGDEAIVPVRVLPFEYSVIPGSITWQKKSGTANYLAGETIALTARILRDNRNTFTDNFGALRAHFLINGTLSPGIEVEPPSGTAPYMGEVHYSYPVPAGQTEPLNVQVLVDAGGLLDEEREDNNTAAVTIPRTISGTAGNNLSIGNTTLRCAPSQVRPGERIELFATIRNGASTVPTKGVRVVFRINGEIINASDIARSASYFQPGQSYTYYKAWTVPQTMTGDLRFTAELDPEGILTGDNRTDNTASLLMPMAKPDLYVEPGSLVAVGNLVSGREGWLKARILNVGAVNAEGVETVFRINGAEVGRSTVDLPAHGMLDVSTAFTVPTLPSVSGTAPLAGVSGYVSNKADFQGIAYTVEIDPSAKIAESNESNNLAGPISLSVLVPAARGVVYGKAEALDGEAVSGVTMTLVCGEGATSGTVSAVTGTDGTCTFTGVPFGPYRIDAGKTGFQTTRTTDAMLYSGDRVAYETLYMDDRCVLAGRLVDGAGQTISGGRVENMTVHDSVRTGSSGSYSLRLTPGTWRIRYMAKGYEPVTEDVTLTPGTTITRDKVMAPTDRMWVEGTAIDANQVILPNLTVQAIDASKAVLAATTTDASGRYRMAVPLAQMEMWIGITASHGGVTRQYPGYVYRGLDTEQNISFFNEPPLETGAGSAEGHVAPYVVCASMPGTFFNPDYEVEAVYGMFDLKLFATVENGLLTYVDIDQTPQPWVSATVSSSWDPGELLGLDEVPGYDIISAILPLSIPLAVKMQSTNHTMVRVRKVVVVSDGRTVYSSYPDVIGDHACAPNVDVDWGKCRVKLYLKVDPDNGVANPAAGYNLDRVLVEFDPKAGTFTKIGNYQVIGWDEANAQEIYMDEP